MSIAAVVVLATMGSAPAFHLECGGACAPYQAKLEDLESKRLSLASELHRSRTKADREAVYSRARQLLLGAITKDILPSWYGTRWAFHGTTETPNSGAIACGTFVGTVLRDAGFNLDRIAMGRLASEHIALSLTSESNLRRYSDRPVKEVEADIVAWGPGLYVVGLDRHAGLAWVDGRGTAHFIHSSYYDPAEVRSERFDADNPLTDSRYRVFAKLLDDRMIQAWLDRRRIPATKVNRRG